MSTFDDFSFLSIIDGHGVVIEKVSTLVGKEINLICILEKEYFRAKVMGFVSGDTGNKQIIIQDYRKDNITIDLCDVYSIQEIISFEQASNNYDKALQKITPLKGKNINFTWRGKKFSNVKVVGIFHGKYSMGDGKNKIVTILDDSGKKHSFYLFHVVSVEEC